MPHDHTRIQDPVQGKFRRQSGISAGFGRLFLCIPLVTLACCARLPASEARGTPAASAAALGFAAISAGGVPLGSAVAVGPDRLLTSAHILPDGLNLVWARRGDGRVTVPARVLARSPIMDLAVLGIETGNFVAVPVANVPVANVPVGAGRILWALGAPIAGPALASGPVLLPSVSPAGRGRGLTAQINALMGYSGGPVLDESGGLQGLVTALLRPGAAPLLAAMTGVDIDSMTRNGHDREIFILSITQAMAESERIAPSIQPGQRYTLTTADTPGP